MWDKNHKRKAALMSDINANPSDPQPLADEELANVSGGGIWDDGIEDSAHDAWYYGRYVVGAGPYQCDYEEWLAKFRPADQLAARDEWIAAGKPKNQVFRA